jgi:hypothetical protein
MRTLWSSYWAGVVCSSAFSDAESAAWLIDFAPKKKISYEFYVPPRDFLGLIQILSDLQNVLLSIPIDFEGTIRHSQISYWSPFAARIFRQPSDPPDFYTRSSGASLVSRQSPRTFVVSPVILSKSPEFHSIRNWISWIDTAAYHISHLFSGDLLLGNQLPYDTIPYHTISYHTIPVLILAEISPSPKSSTHNLMMRHESAF